MKPYKRYRSFWTDTIRCHRVPREQATVTQMMGGTWGRSVRTSPHRVKGDREANKTHQQGLLIPGL